MPYQFITSAAQLRELLEKLRDVPAVVFDTEFISEGRYYPELCLIQIAAGDQSAIIDPLSAGDLDAMWELFCSGKQEIIVHACRSEMEFCYRSVGKMPPNLFDVQLAAGFLGTDYPVGLAALLAHHLGINLKKGETRSTWNKRPLSPQQIDYALDDVRHLEQLAGILKTKLRDKNRLDWYYEEIETVKQHHLECFSIPRWRNLPKSSGLRPRESAIQREIWFWREEIARSRNMPVNRVLRDDLIVELARRGTANPQSIAALRGFQRSDASRIVPEIAAAVERALQLPESELPEMSRHLSYPQYSVMTQFLFVALCLICKRRRIAQQLVGGPGDVREFIAAELKTLPAEIHPRLLHGWRSELVGTFLTDLLNGNAAIHLDKTRPEEPLVFC
ncbi:MAG: ribonuclease D [Planctomycetaceae bacterium]|jgi:ribonuclease D|nr:ribonuclease D [Planctomycetaceae bacterium]